MQHKGGQFCGLLKHPSSHPSCSLRVPTPLNTGTSCSLWVCGYLTSPKAIDLPRKHMPVTICSSLEGLAKHPTQLGADGSGYQSVHFMLQDTAESPDIQGKHLELRTSEDMCIAKSTTATKAKGSTTCNGGGGYGMMTW